MPSPAHKKLIERIENLDKVPDDATEYETWIKANAHLGLLRDNEREDELIVYGLGRYSFIHSVVVSLDNLTSVDQEDLLQWGGNPFSSLAGYNWGSEQDSVWIETDTDWGAKTLSDAQQLVFAREIKGLRGSDALYYEVLQIYLHVTDIHWRSEQHAYCRFDENGDFDHIVSVTSKEDKGSVTLVSFKREPLDLYLAASNSVLIRMFEFPLRRPERSFEVPDWPHEPKVLNESDSLIYRHFIDPGKESHTRGAQIIRPRRPKSEIFSSLKDSWSSRTEGPYVDFLAWDWRNRRISKVSTDPDSTTNYIQIHENSLPHELSIAFFRPEVLLRYKADQDKYTIGSGIITCRSAWELRSYHVNEVNQVHAYICDLRDLPLGEQQYWLSFNERPKAGISQSVIEADFKGEWPSVADPLHEVLFIAEEWKYSDVTWWKLRDEALLGHVSKPLTNSRQEWAGAFSDLSKMLIEGFKVKAIRAKLSEMGIAFCKEEKSLSLIEKVLIGHAKLANGGNLNGLREVHDIRSKVYGHFGGSDADALAKNALQEHDTYTAHFESVCETVADELKLIEQTFS
ncbi:MAG: hypothetical protein OXE05_13565 [Chloroflexi bacterium]|nr:hypothetical protein [Chloroflexota bacterium]